MLNILTEKKFQKERNHTIKAIKTTSNTRITELDGLRGIAILLVLSFHYVNNQLVNAQSFIAKLLCKATSFGWVGVDLFFVLSGFLIGSILIKNKDSKNFFTTFYIRRVVRIIPNYYLAITLFFIICAIPYFQDNIFLTGNNVLPWWSYFAMFHNIFMGRMNTMGNISMSITWSIGIEEQFYLIFPLIIFFIKERWLPSLLVLVIIVANVVRMQIDKWVPTYVLLPARMDAIAVGILVAYYYLSADFSQFVYKYRNLLSLTVIGPVVIGGFLYWRYNDLFAIKHTFFAIFFSGCLVFALTLKNSLYAKILRYKPLVWIGTISYSLYLFQYFILGIFHHFAGNKGGIIIANGRDVVVTILALITTVLLSWAVYNLLELPMVKLGKRYRY